MRGKIKREADQRLDDEILSIKDQFEDECLQDMIDKVDKVRKDLDRLEQEVKRL